MVKRDEWVKRKMWWNWCKIKNKKRLEKVKEGTFTTWGGIAKPFPSIIPASVPSTEQER